jgi:uncharacterized protein YhaN
MLLSMAVMARERWTDERLDKAFDRVDADLRELRVEMRRGFDQIDKRFEQIDKRFERVDDKFDSLQRNMTTWFVALFSTILASLITGVFAIISLT